MQIDYNHFVIIILNTFKKYTNTTELPIQSYEMRHTLTANDNK